MRNSKKFLQLIDDAVSATKAATRAQEKVYDHLYEMSEKDEIEYCDYEEVEEKVRQCMANVYADNSYLFGDCSPEEVKAFFLEKVRKEKR